MLLDGNETTKSVMKLTGIATVALLLAGSASIGRAQDSSAQEPASQEPQPAAPQQKNSEDPVSKAIEARTPLPVVIWHKTVDVNQLDLLYGAGGKEDAPSPNAKYKFVKEYPTGSNPKFEVQDDAGVKWKVKLGHEPQAETAATRLLFAAGYFVDEDYYVSELRVSGLPKLHKGDSYVTDGEIVRGARLERKDKESKKIGNWEWMKNPFANTQEFNGLRVMMALINNWDLKTINNSIYQMPDQVVYAVTDVGATFGRTGNTASRSKGNVKDFEKTKFIEKVKGDEVDFVLHSRPLFITAVDLPNYKERTEMESVTKHIPRADAKWLGQRLAQLSEKQIGDCFRAGGYSEEEVARYSRVILDRIAELNAL